MVSVSEARPVRRVRYTMFIPGAGGDEIVAEGVTLERALVVAVEHGRTGKTTVVHRDHGDFRIFEIGLRPPDAMSFERILEIAVARTPNAMADADNAMDQFGAILLSDPRVYWNGCIETDEAYERRSSNP